MADAQHTEKPTQRRLDRARKEGNFPSSREFVGAAHFAGAVCIIALFSGTYRGTTGGWRGTPGEESGAAASSRDDRSRVTSD